MSIEVPNPTAPQAAAPAKRSAVEIQKETSHLLRGTIAEVLREDSDKFGDADKNLLKFHGTYQQEDRDARKMRRSEGLGKFHVFMVRCKIPGGRLTAAQYLAVDDLASQYASGTLRFTSRQGIQLHGVLKKHLKEAIAGINTCLLTTLGACGDVERNLMACPAPLRHTPARDQLQEAAALLARHLAPRTGAYHEIWLDGKPIENGAQGEKEEPLYGKVYLPRKFKTGLALPEDNCCDIYAQDLGFLAILEKDQIVGYNVLVGGGMGMTHGNAHTFPFVARAMCYIPAAELVPTAEAVIRLFRDHGNRGDRKRARIKYLVHDWGVDRFREVLAGYLRVPLTLPRPVEVSAVDLHLGWQPQGDGKWFYGLSIENGRVKDEGSLRLRSGLRALVQRFGPELRITPQQDILLCNLESSALPELKRTLAEHGITPPEKLSLVQKHSMSCPAIPTCGLAISESERALPGIIDQLEVMVRELGLDGEAIGVRMTGCPNGCVRPYQSDIGIVGRTGDKYTVFVGGHLLGTRLNFELRDLVPRAQILPLLRPLLLSFRSERRPGESFGDYCHRLGKDHVRALLPAIAPLAETGVTGQESGVSATSVLAPES